jgi:hypothetical protein
MERSSSIYMNRVAARSNVILMNRVPARSNVIYMTPVDGRVGGGAGGGKGGVSIVWTFKGIGLWPGTWSTTGWNTSPGDFISVYPGYPVTATGYKYVKILPHPTDPSWGSNHYYWTKSTGVNVYTIQFKSTVSAGVAGSTISLGADCRYAIGTQDVNPAGCSNYYGYALYWGK